MVRVIAQNMDICILWVGGEVEGMHKVVTWLGGFLIPAVGENNPYTAMSNYPAGNIEGDIIVILSDSNEDMYIEYEPIIDSWLDAKGIEHA